MKRLSAVILAALSFSQVAFAAEPAPLVEAVAPKKALGRGVADKHAQEALQLACVGAPVSEGSLERSCDRLRFLFRDHTGTSYLIGPILHISDDDSIPVSDQITSELISFQLMSNAARIRHRPRIVDILVPILTLGNVTLPPQKSESFGGLGLGHLEDGDEEYYFGLNLNRMIGTTTGLWFSKSFRNLGISSFSLKEALSKSVPAWSIKPRDTDSDEFQYVKLLLIGTSVGRYSGPCTFRKDKSQLPIEGLSSYRSCLIVLKGDDYKQLLDDPNVLLKSAEKELQ